MEQRSEEAKAANEQQINLTMRATNEPHNESSQ